MQSENSGSTGNISNFTFLKYCAAIWNRYRSNQKSMTSAIVVLKLSRGIFEFEIRDFHKKPNKIFDDFLIKRIIAYSYGLKSNGFRVIKGLRWSHQPRVHHRLI